jgi:hypothetical protein
VCRPTPIVRCMPMSETSSKTTHALHGTIGRTVSFLPATLRGGTRTIFTCVRARELLIHSFCRVHKWKWRPLRGAAFIPMAEARGLSPRMVNVKNTQKLGFSSDSPSFCMYFSFSEIRQLRKIYRGLAENLGRKVGYLIWNIHLFATGTTMVLFEEIILQIFI